MYWILDAVRQFGVDHAMQVAQLAAERTRELQLLSARQRQLLEHLEVLQDEERRRIARELHDSLGQQLTAVSLSLGSVQEKLGGRAVGEYVAEDLDPVLGQRSALRGRPEHGAFDRRAVLLR